LRRRDVIPGTTGTGARLFSCRRCEIPIIDCGGVIRTSLDRSALALAFGAAHRSSNLLYGAHLMLLSRSAARRGCAALVTVLAVLASSCDTLPVVPCLESDGGCPGCEARSCKDASVMALAHDLDSLEAHLERYGSVVAKQPDVWGQARMTKHREEYEKEM